MNILLLSMPGGSELLLIGGVVLLLFGGKKIPELMRGLGKGIREFNDAKNGVKEDIENSVEKKEKTNLENNKQNSTATIQEEVHTKKRE